MVKRCKSFMGDRHKGAIPRHFTKRLHERLKIGATLELPAAIAAAIQRKDLDRVRYVRDVPRIKRTHDQREEWLVNIGGIYVAVIFNPIWGFVHTCHRPTASIEAVRTRDRVRAEGGLTPFYSGRYLPRSI